MSPKLQHEALSVIVQPQDDSRDSSSQLLSPTGKITPNSAEMIDTSDFRALHEPTYQTLTSVNGQMSPPGFSPNSSYATLTPLQPLPPISTMSDKFSYGHSSSISVRIFRIFKKKQQQIELNQLIFVFFFIFIRKKIANTKSGYKFMYGCKFTI